MAPVGPEVPEADALEQSAPVVPDDEEVAAKARPKVPLEASEADVLEQAQEVPDEDDWRY